MFAHERHQEILDVLERQPSISVQRLTKSLKASPATIRRDLDFLEKKGQVVRIRGGVVHPDNQAGEPSFEQRLKDYPSNKKAIARTAANLVPEKSTVFIDAGTTCLELGRLLLAREDLTLFTNSCPLVNIPTRRQARLICVGGELREISRAMVGGFALDWLGKLQIDIAFFGASGLAPEGASTTELSETEVKSQAMARSRRCILLADGSKWCKPSTFLFSEWGAFDTWITDAPEVRKDYLASPIVLTQVILAK
ncbi:MAG: DeoR/GlpR family DNA-binding transcription regulator [Fibrobacterota bacterium]|nr:DeoR/GlpR family DNA-binding transcription regulator [Fibrobacterota bacterium]